MAGVPSDSRHERISLGGIMHVHQFGDVQSAIVIEPMF